MWIRFLEMRMMLNNGFHKKEAMSEAHWVTLQFDLLLENRRILHFENTWRKSDDSKKPTLSGTCHECLAF